MSNIYNKALWLAISKSCVLSAISAIASAMAVLCSLSVFIFSTPQENLIPSLNTCQWFILPSTSHPLGCFTPPTAYTDHHHTPQDSTGAAQTSGNNVFNPRSFCSSSPGPGPSPGHATAGGSSPNTTTAGLSGRELKCGRNSRLAAAWQSRMQALCSWCPCGCGPQPKPPQLL